MLMKAMVIYMWMPLAINGTPNLDPNPSAPLNIRAGMLMLKDETAYNRRVKGDVTANRCLHSCNMAPLGCMQPVHSVAAQEKLSRCPI